MPDWSNHLLLLKVVVGVLLFVNGFLPYVPSDGLSDEDPQQRHNASLHPAVVGKVVLIVIDAWRWDFVHPLERTPMIHTKNYIEEMGFLKLAKAGTPTVTLPRIKALVSGTLPGFVDVIVNLAGQAMDKDSFIRRAKLAGKNLTFFGDDTWLRLFPDTFIRHDGTVSFFVNDYTEVDNNVTRHLEDELERQDWDVMVLHYLGLDHIGHTLGPKSSVVKTKLKEMDDVVDKIVTSLVKEFDDDRTSLPPLVVICGDHGMSDGGSHGGSSASEVDTPLVFISPLYRDSPPGSSALQPVQQVDLASTLSVLMGLPIPSSSIGRFISDAWPVSSNRLEVTRLSYDHLLAVSKEQLGRPPERCVLLSEMGSLDEAGKCLQEAVLNVVAYYDLYKMFLGMVLVGTSCFAAVLKVLDEESRWTRLRHVESSGGSVFVLKSGLSIFSWAIVSFGLCRWNSAFTSSNLCLPTPSYFSASVAVIVWSCLSSAVIDVIRRLLQISRNFSFSLDQIVLLAPVFMAVAAGSTSFIEEEHYLWYHMSTTVLVFTCLKSIQNQNVDSQLLRSPKSNVCLKPSSVALWFRLASMLALLRLLRSWNQTGDKWMNVTDVGDILNDPENSGWLLLSVVGGLAVIMLVVHATETSVFVKLLVACSLIFVYAFHAQASGLFSGSLWSARGKLEARIVFFIVTIGCCVALVEYLIRESHSFHEGESSVCFLRKLRIYLLVLSTLLGKTHNVSHIAMDVVLQELYFSSTSSLMSSVDRSRWPGPSVLLCHWVGAYVMGMSSFFAQGFFFFMNLLKGNSNSLATVHLASGYVGLDGHSTPIVGFLLIVSTYSRLILWILRAGEELATVSSVVKKNCSFIDSDKVVGRSKSSFVLAVLWARCLPLAIFLLVLYISREHLFIWTVFAPKLLYDSMATLVCVLLSVIITL